MKNFSISYENRGAIRPRMDGARKEVLGGMYPERLMIVQAMSSYGWRMMPTCLTEDMHHHVIAVMRVLIANWFFSI